MKLPEFDHSEKQWDEYGAFHVTSHNPHAFYGYQNKQADNCFVQFEDGSLLVTNPGRHNRQMHYKFGCAIGWPQELRRWGATFIDPETGKEIPAAWLYKNSRNETRSPTLLLDVSAQRVYSLTNPLLWGKSSDLNQKFSGLVPRHAECGRMYWANLSGEPVVYEGLAISKPSRYNKSETLEHLRKLAPSARAVMALHEGNSYVPRWIKDQAANMFLQGMGWNEVLEAVAQEYPRANYDISLAVAHAVMEANGMRVISEVPYINIAIRDGSELSRI